MYKAFNSSLQNSSKSYFAKFTVQKCSKFWYEKTEKILKKLLYNENAVNLKWMQENLKDIVAKFYNNFFPRDIAVKLGHIKFCEFYSTFF